MKSSSTQRQITRLALAATLAFGILGSSSVQAVTWDGGGSPNLLWSTGTNWTSPETAPANSFSDSFIFAGTTNVGTTLNPLNNDLTGGTATSITFNSGAGAFVIGGNAITLGGNITNNEGTNVQTLNMTIDRGAADRTITTVLGGKLVLGGALSSGTASNNAFNVEGAGTLALAGSWSDTDVGFRVRNGGTLDLKDGSTITGRALNTGAGNSTINVGSGTYNFSATSSSFASENATSATSYNQTGGNITFGQLTLANGQGTSTTMNISAGTLNASTLRTSRGPTTTAANDATTDATLINISGTGLVNAGTFQFGDTATGYYGKNTVTITGSTAELRATTGFNWGNNGANVRNNTVEVNGGLFSTVATTATNTASIATLNIGNGGTLQARGASTDFLVGLDTFNIKNGGAVIDTQEYAITITNNILNFSGATTDSLTKSGAGTLTLSGTNTYTGGTNINLGTLQANHASALGSSGNITFGGGTLQYASASKAVNYGSRIKSSTAIKLDLNGQNISALTGIDNTNTNGLNLSNSGVVTSNGGTVAFSATNSYTGGTTVGNKVRVNLTHASGLSSGNVTIDSGGQVYLNNGVASVPNNFTLNGTGYSGDSTPLGAIRMTNASSIASGSTVTLATASTISVDNGTATINGKITGGGNLTVNTSVSSGTLILTNSSNDYSGNTTVAAGTLALSGSGSLANTTGIHLSVGTSTFDVSAKTGNFTLVSTQTLSGSGKVVIDSNSGFVASGTLSPGNSPGTTTVDGGGAFTLGTNGNYNWQIRDAAGAAGTGYDTYNLVNGSSLDLSLLTSANPYKINLWSLSAISPDAPGNATNFDNTLEYTWKLFSTANLITLPGGGFNSNLFTVNTLANNGTTGFSNIFGTGQFVVGLDDGGTDLVLNYIPEPTTTAFGLLAMGGLLLRRRR